jgi:glycerophosphoryl diester phosphodiesterase
MKWHWGLLIILSTSLSNCSKNNLKPNIDVFGHAGTSLHRDRAVYPANSFESIKYALDVLDADGVEVDVQMTKDSVLVLYHDSYLDQASTFIGCISEYNYADIEYLKLDFTKYELVTLKKVLKFVESRQKSVYLDVKTYNYCSNNKISQTSFQYALNNSLDELDTNFKKTKILLGMTDYQFLNAINFPVKCYETTNVSDGIQIANANNFTCLSIFKQFINKQDATLLNKTSIYWGVVGVKDKWTIDEVVQLLPKFIVSDNVARTKKVTN